MEFVCRVVHIDHFLPDLISKREKLPTNVVKTRSQIVVIFCRCRDCGCGCWCRCGCWCGRRRVRSISRCSQPLCHLSNLVDSALSKAESQGPEIEHPNVLVLVVPLAARWHSLRRLAAARGRLTIRGRLSLLVLAARAGKAQSEDHSPRAIRGRLLPVPGNRAPASWTHLLPLQPALEAAKVQDMTARELLRAAPLNLRCVSGVPGAHLLSANDARVLPAELFRRSVRILGHVLDSLAIADESMQPLEKRPRRHEPIPHYVDGQAIKAQKDAEK